jgi:starch phosphorylase
VKVIRKLISVIYASVRDGWWYEGYDGSNGWAIDSFKGGNAAEEDRADSEALYRLLENDIVPLYYDRDRKGVPHRWIQIAKAAIKSVSPVFNASRMMKEYTEKMYIPAASASKSAAEITVTQRG